MNVVFIIPSLRKGGAERVVSKLSNSLVAQGHTVNVIIFQNEIEYSLNCNVIPIGSPSSNNILSKLTNGLVRTLRLRKLLKTLEPDKVFSFTETCNFPVILTLCEIIVSVRNYPSIKLTKIQKLLVFILYRFPNVKSVVSVSDNIKNCLEKKYYLRNVVTIANPVCNEIEICGDGFNYQSKFKPKQYWLAVGRLNNQKGFDLLIKAYNNSKNAQKYPLVIVGEGTERHNLNELISILDLDQKVTLLGSVTDISSWYKECFCFILSSRFEGFPNVLIEALYNNCAVISTNCPSGPDEIIENGYNGLLCDISDVSLEKTMDYIIKNKQEYKNISSNARESIEHLEVEKITKDWLSL